jgi:hypothetical protein
MSSGFVTNYITPEKSLFHTWYKVLLSIRKAEVRYSNLESGLADVDLKNKPYILGLNTTSFLSDQC